MTKREEIEKWAFVFLRPAFTGKGLTEEYVDELTTAYVCCFLKGLSRRGVVIKVERESPENPFDKSCGLNESVHNGFELACLKYKRAGYVATMPLIEVEE